SPISRPSLRVSDRGSGFPRSMASPARAGAARCLPARRTRGPRSRCFCRAPMAGEIAVQPTSALGSGRILLVEDDRRVAEATQDLLRNIGFDTRWAGDGTAALALVESDPKLALVLSDVVMPGGVSGLDLARTLRDRRPELPVILATGYSSYASEVVAEGFALIEKPYRRDVLAASLRSALETRGPKA